MAILIYLQNVTHLVRFMNLSVVLWQLCYFPANFSDAGKFVIIWIVTAILSFGEARNYVTAKRGTLDIVGNLGTPKKSH